MTEETRIDILDTTPIKIPTITLDKNGMQFWRINEFEIRALTVIIQGKSETTSRILKWLKDSTLSGYIDIATPTIIRTLDTAALIPIITRPNAFTADYSRIEWAYPSDEDLALFQLKWGGAQ